MVGDTEMEYNLIFGDTQMAYNFNPEKNLIKFSGIFQSKKNIFKHFATNPNAKWSYGQNIENWDPTPFNIQNFAI